MMFAIHIILQYILDRLKEVGFFMTFDGNVKGVWLRLAGYWLWESPCGPWVRLVGLSAAANATVLLPEADRQVLTTTEASMVGEVSLIRRMDEPWPRVCTRTRQRCTVPPACIHTR